MNVEGEIMSSNRKRGSTGGTADCSSVAGLFLSFRLADEEYGIQIHKVQEIIGLMPITAVPKMPDFVRGVINLRGKVIPVVDLRLKFGFEAGEQNEKNCIIVVQIEKGQRTEAVGVLVDEVLEVMNIPAPDLAPPPSVGSTVEINFVLALGKVDNRVVILLDVNRVLSGEELKLIT